MVKKSRKHSLSLENEHGSCMWGLISLLDFHHPRNLQKLLLDRRHGSSRCSLSRNQSSEKGSSQSKHSEKQKFLDYAGNFRSESGEQGRSIRLLLEEEISKLQPAKKEIRLRSGDGVFSAENNMQAVLKSNITFKPENDDRRISTRTEPNNPSFEDVSERFSINLNLVALLQEFYSEKVGGLHENSIRDSIEQYPFMRIDYSKLNNYEKQTNQSEYILRKTLNEILEVFLCDKINDLKRSGCFELQGQSKPSNIALDVINLNKELFLKFLQDPNSHLAKYIQELQISRSKKILSSDSCKLLEGIKLLGNNCGNQYNSSSSSKQLWIQMIQNIFRKKDKNVKPSKESANSLVRSSIVVLKPIPLRTEDLHDLGSANSSPRPLHSLKASGQSEGAVFRLSFHQIKRKMKQVIERKKEQHISSTKKEPHLSSLDKIQQTELQGSYSGLSIKRIPVSGMHTSSKIIRSDNDALSQLSYDVKKNEKKPSLENTLVPNRKDFSSTNRESNFQREAKKHLIEMLDFEYGNFHPSTKVSRTLETMLSLERKRHHGLSLSKIKMSPIHTPSQDDAKQYSTTTYDLGGSLDINKNLIGRPQLHDFSSETPNADMEVMSCSEAIPKDGTKSSDVSVSKDVSGDNLISVDITGGTANMDLGSDDDLSHPHLKLGVIEVDQQILTPLAPPGVLLVKNMEAPECFTEKSKQPSPVSVLDTSFLDDSDSYRTAVKIEPAELPVTPRNLQFEEENDELTITTDETTMQSWADEELRFEYVRFLLEASGLASKESWWRWHSSRCLLHPSIYHQVETRYGCFLDDLNLLFDCVNEVLENICCRYCTRMPWVSFIQPYIRPFPFDEDLVKEVWIGTKNVNNSCLVNGTLDQIIGRDLDTVAWMDTQLNVNEIGIALEDEIWEEILEETMIAMWD